MQAKPSLNTSERVARIVGSKATKWVPISKGYTAAERWVVSFENKTSVFVKAATNNETANWLRKEYFIYSNLKADYLPRLLGWDDNTYPILILEDLNSGYWPPPWSPGQIKELFATMEKISTTPPPPGIHSLEEHRNDFTGWHKIQKDPKSFLTLGLCAENWLLKYLPQFVKAEQNAVLDKNEFIHLDIRSDNVCFTNDRVLLVDWNWACRGNSKLDLIYFLPSLYMERSGPPPWKFTLEEPELIACTSGYAAYNAPLPPIPTPRGKDIRKLQLDFIKVTFPWLCKSLKIPEPQKVA